jgi:protein O-mannosyl-transferase
MKPRFWAILTIILLTTAIYIRVVHHDFINWDGDKLIYQNDDITKIDLNHIKKIFSTFYVQMYQPVTTLTYAIEYKFFGLNPKVYHLDNMFIHIINSILVLMFIFRLTGNNMISFLTAISFAIHPMHVESVAWTAERKDLVYTFFYLVSLIYYLSYLEKGYRKKHLLLPILFFVLSLLSKSAAVTLPLVLILLDQYKKREFNIKNNIDKIPFLLLALIFGIITLYSQLVFSAPRELYEHQAVYDRFFISSYSFCFYFFKALIPVHLSALHPFPIKYDIFLPFKYYLSFAIVIIISYLIFRYRDRILPGKLKRDIAFGIAFFVCTICIILSLPVGAAVVAERYTYVPYIGLVFALSSIFDDIYKRIRHDYRKYFIVFLAVMILFYSFLSFQRLSVWKERIVFWTDIIHKYPMKVPLAYHNRGLTYFRNKDYVDALKDFNVVISQKPLHYNSYNYRGLTRSALNDPLGAISDFSYALMLKNDQYEIYNNRGIEYKKIQNMDAAINDFTTCIRINPAFADPYSNIGLILLETGKAAEAIPYFTKTIALSPTTFEPYYNRGLANYNINEFQPAINDFSKAISINDTVAATYCDRAISYARAGYLTQALLDFNRAIALNPSLKRAYFNRGIVKIQMNEISASCLDFQIANSPPNPKAIYYLNKYCK